MTVTVFMYQIFFRDAAGVIQYVMWTVTERLFSEMSMEEKTLHLPLPLYPGETAGDCSKIFQSANMPQQSQDAVII